MALQFCIMYPEADDDDVGLGFHWVPSLATAFVEASDASAAAARSQLPKDRQSRASIADAFTFATSPRASPRQRNFAGTARAPTAVTTDPMAPAAANGGGGGDGSLPLRVQPVSATYGGGGSSDTRSPGGNIRRPNRFALQVELEAPDAASSAHQAEPDEVQVVVK